MQKTSAGILPFRKINGILEFFLVHPGGPFWIKKDIGAWSITKGEFTNEDPIDAAKREFEEETSISINEISKEKFISLGQTILKSGKVIFAFGIEMNIDAEKIKSNTFKIGLKEFPEIDRGQWFDEKTSLSKINESQRVFILELTKRLQS